MELNLLAAITATGSASIVIATLAIGLGAARSARIRIAAGLSLWFVLVVVLGATGALNYEHGLGNSHFIRCGDDPHTIT